ncbi:hypothetical protein [Streptomyces sp. CC208A]|uniref:hypothetical protein n=1 Tax=Streptomyces sp. CC208A TaxID=3044573 RepID=UPI0024A82AB4|nr:hypothetical protein [Streptomyces sp. CC208A]
MTPARRLSVVRATLDQPTEHVPGQTAIPLAALAVIEAALEDGYRAREPLNTQARRIIHDLTRDGWKLTIPPRTRRYPCPICTTNQLVNANGRLRRHGAPSNACRGSGWTITPAGATP